MFSKKDYDIFVRKESEKRARLKLEADEMRRAKKAFIDAKVAPTPTNKRNARRAKSSVSNRADLVLSECGWRKQRSKQREKLSLQWCALRHRKVVGRPSCPRAQRRDLWVQPESFIDVGRD